MKHIRSALLVAVLMGLGASAHAQRKGDFPQGPSKGQVQNQNRYPQPNPYPPGTKGNPGYYPPHSTYPYPSYPSYPNYPAYPNYPYPTYPSAQVAPCVVLGVYDGRSTIYQVMDSYGRLIGSTRFYAEALNIADTQQRYGSCYGVIFQSQNQGTNYPNSSNYCQVMSGGNAYGQILYRVLDRAGRVLVSTTDYSQAQYISQSDARCFQYN